MQQFTVEFRSVIMVSCRRRRRRLRFKLHGERVWHPPRVSHQPLLLLLLIPRGGGGCASFCPNSLPYLPTREYRPFGWRASRRPPPPPLMTMHTLYSVGGCVGAVIAE